ncbi:protein shank [Calliphora vicina]|uniref:protein shank n=1 Tax=Calliphora vicina TaxID=7373 RepID=UPI00325BB4FF
MSKNSDKPRLYPSTAPSAPDDFQRGPPPPSYEECLKMNGAAGTAPHQYTYSNPTPYQQQQAFLPPPGPSSSYGYANPYQTHIQQQQIFYNTANPSPQSGMPQTTAENVLYLAKGAKVRTTATGAISIPPPPPGCAPTPGQMAAMSGQPVMIKKEKKSFF